MNEEHLESILKENRHFEPSVEFAALAQMQPENYERLYRESIENPEKFWGDVASELHWFKKWDSVLDESEKPFFKWFAGGKTNIAYNCIDRHIQGPNRN